MSRTYFKISASSPHSSSMKLNPSDADEDEEESFILEYLFIIKSPILTLYIKLYKNVKFIA